MLSADNQEITVNTRDVEFHRRMRAGDSPDWRWRRARNLIADGRQPDLLDDELTHAACWFCQAAADSRNVLGSPMTHGHIAAAHTIYDENTATRWEIESRLLTDIPVVEIGSRLKIEPGVIEVYIKLFFDVVDRANHVGWLAIHLPVGFFTPADPTEAQIWMHVAATGHGAAAALELLISDYRNPMAAQIPDQHQKAEDIRNLVRFTCTQPTPTPAYRRLLKNIWRILATRVTAPDPLEWQRVIQHMDALELVAEIRPKRQPPPSTTSGHGGATTGTENEAATRPSEPVEGDGNGGGRQPTLVGNECLDDLAVTSVAIDGTPECMPGWALFQAAYGRLCWPKWSPKAGLAVA